MGQIQEGEATFPAHLIAIPFLSVNSYYLIPSSNLRWALGRRFSKQAAAAANVYFHVTADLALVFFSPGCGEWEA